jgi:hypothetical protein
LHKKPHTRLSWYMAIGTLILLVLNLGATLGNVAPVTALGIQAGNVAQNGDNNSTAVNYTIVVDDWRREINIDAWGTISVTDYFLMTNNLETEASYVFVALPLNVTSVLTQDPYGIILRDVSTVSTPEGYIEATVFLREPVQLGEKFKILVTYRLPRTMYLTQQGWQDYTLNIRIGKPDDWFVKQLSVIVILPEGAEFQGTTKQPYEVQKESFSTRVEFSEVNVTEFSEPSFTLRYTYIILWAAFKPALWIGTGAIIVAFVVFLKRMTPRFYSTVEATTPFSPEILRDFVNKYDERRRLKSELDSLETQVRRGKLSRRRHRLRRSSIDGRLSRLEKDLVELKAQLSSVGGSYAERIKHLETAEAEIETLDRDIERTDRRFQRKEISAETRRRLLDEYSRIKERAENTIAETILRLREEIR